MSHKCDFVTQPGYGEDICGKDAVDFFERNNPDTVIFARCKHHFPNLWKHCRQVDEDAYIVSRIMEP